MKTLFLLLLSAYVSLGVPGTEDYARKTVARIAPTMDAVLKSGRKQLEAKHSIQFTDAEINALSIVSGEATVEELMRMADQFSQYQQYENYAVAYFRGNISASLTYKVLAKEKEKAVDDLLAVDDSIMTKQREKLKTYEDQIVTLKAINAANEADLVRNRTNGNAADRKTKTPATRREAPFYTRTGFVMLGTFLATLAVVWGGFVLHDLFNVPKGQVEVLRRVTPKCEMTSEHVQALLLHLQQGGPNTERYLARLLREWKCTQYSDVAKQWLRELAASGTLVAHEWADNELVYGLPGHTLEVRPEPTPM